MLLLLDLHSSFLTLINIYSRPNFVPSLDTIGAKLLSPKMSYMVNFNNFSTIRPILNPKMSLNRGRQYLEHCLEG